MHEKTFFIGTPIYYSNGVPHIGHAYTSLIADTIARYKRYNGYAVKFSTGVDENSQKCVEKANELGMDTMAYLDMMATEHKAVWDGIGIEYTDFIRTTEERHARLVQKMLQISYDRGDIYEGIYEGKYCVGCEAFKKDSDLTPDGHCSDHPKMQIQELREKNYFFRLSRYQSFLEDFYTTHPDFVIPEHRFREVIEFVRGGLEDFSISRETNRFGIPLPFDPSQVTYVWYDALFNYVTACQDGQEKFWPIDLHVLGKDIIRFHAIYWPAMLQSAGLPLPRQILTGGHFTIDGQKMSKSLGNVIEPVAFATKHGRDLMALYLFYAFPIGSDGDFSETQAITLYNAKLANNIGNLLNRFTTLATRADMTDSLDNTTIDTAVRNECTSAIKVYTTAMNTYDLRIALETIFVFADTLNKYVDTHKPWELLKSPNRTDDLKHVLSTLGEGVRVIGLMLSPFFAAKSQALFEEIGVKHMKSLDEGMMDASFLEKVTFHIKK